MIQRLFCCTLLVILFLSCSSTEKIPPKPPIMCGIQSFESRAGMQAGEAESVSEMLSAALQQSGRFTVIERKQLSAVLKEQGFQSTQEGADGVKAGKIMAIRKLFSGSIGKLGDKFVVNLKMIDVESSQVDLAISRTFDDDLEDIDEEFLPGLVKEVLIAIDGPPQK
jgi:TolB-like protein